jgi:hypothetical protein
MVTDNSYEKKRKEILEKISDIRTMRKGVVSEYFVKTKLKDGNIKTNGPYYSITLKAAKGKTVGNNIPAELVDLYKSETENYRRFRELSEEYVNVCEEESIQSMEETDAAEKLKKNKRSK